MATIRSHMFRRIVSGLSLIAVLTLAFGAFAVSSATTAEAARPSLGASCSAKSTGGVTTVTLKLTLKNGTAGQTMDHPGLGTGSTAVTGASTQSIGPFTPDPGTYTIRLLDTDNTTVLRTAIVTIAVNGSRVSCSVRVS